MCAEYYAENPALLSYANQWQRHLFAAAAAEEDASTSLSPQQQHHQPASAASTATAAAGARTTVFGLAFANTASVNHTTAAGHYSNWLIGCTDGGELCVWALPDDSSGDDELAASSMDCSEDEDKGASSSHSNQEFAIDQNRIAASPAAVNRSPLLRLQLSDSGALYACQVVGRPDGSQWVVVAGDFGVKILDWEADLGPLLLLQQQQQEEAGNGSTKTVSAAQPYTGKVRAHFKPFPSPFEDCIEVNDFVLHGNHLYGAAGDQFGAYKWDINTEKVVCNYKEKGMAPTAGGYLHTTELVPNTSLLLFGGEGGILSLWDVAKDQPVDRFDMNNQQQANITTSTAASLQPRPPQSRQRTRPDSTTTTRNSSRSCWISSCKARDENWWSVAGGYSGSSTDDDRGGGFVSTFHGPTRSLVSTVATRETPQQLAYYCSSSSSSSSSSSTDDYQTSTLLSVANESFVSHWNDPLSLCSNSSSSSGDPHCQNRQRVYCNQASAYAVTVSPDAKRIAVGGVGAVVDIFEQKTQYGMQLSLQ